MMKTSIIILTYNKLEYTIKCIESIRKYTEKGTYEIIIVDNASTDGTVEWLQNQEDIIKIYNKENLGFPKGCNQGIKIATGDNVMLLNNDVIVTKNWLDNLVKHLYSSKDIGAVGPVTNNSVYFQWIKVDYKNINEMQTFAEKYNEYNPSLCEERIKLIGFCMIIKKEVINKVGLLDEAFTPGNFEDDDLSIRIVKEGYKLIFCKDTFIHHYGSISFEAGKREEEYQKLLIRNKKIIDEKLGIDIYHIICIRPDIISIMKDKKASALNVLQLECGGGGLLLQIKNKFPNAVLYGVEKHENTLVNKNLEAKITT